MPSFKINHMLIRQLEQRRCPFQYSDFPLLQVPLAELEKDEFWQVALAENVCHVSLIQNS